VSTRANVPHPLPDPLIELVAQRFRVLGEPMRIKLLDRLREGDATVGELQEALGASQQNVSKHLGILLSAGMVARTKQGNQVCGGVRRQLRDLEAILQPT
jgi:DNA-binding transcriptional ArsR family regulator